jgi:hypothetical protein
MKVNREIARLGGSFHLADFFHIFHSRFATGLRSAAMAQFKQQQQINVCVFVFSHCVQFLFHPVPCQKGCGYS